MINLQSIYGFLFSAGFHTLLLGILAAGALGPPAEREPPMLVVSQWVAHDLTESVEIELPLLEEARRDVPVVAPPGPAPMAVAEGYLDGVLDGDLPDPSDHIGLSLGLPGGLLDATGGGIGDQEAGASFFGTSVSGRRFVYVVDASVSMAGSRFRKAKRELFRSVCNLRPDQEYYVIFFGLGSYPMYLPECCPDLVPSKPETWRRLHRWMRDVDPRIEGQTNGKAAILQALALEPDAVYVLTDGVFTDDTVVTLLATDDNPIPIHTIAFGSDAARRDLQQIAGKHHGTYRFVR